MTIAYHCEPKENSGSWTAHSASRPPPPRSRPRRAPGRRGRRGPARRPARRPRSRRRTTAGTGPPPRRVQPSASWAYRLAKKKIDTNVTDSRKSTRLSTAKARLRKIPRSISGSAVRRSTSTKTSSRAAPAAMQPIVAGSPEPRAGLLEAEHREAHGARDQHGAAVVQATGMLALGRVRAGGEHERDDRDGDVDPEDRAPGPFGQEAAEQRADGGEPAGDPEEGGQRLAALAQGVGLHHDRQRSREHDGRAGALQHAEGDHPCLADPARRRRPAQRRAGGEADHAHDHHPPAPGDVGELAAEGEQRRQREHVAVDDPLGAGRGEPDVLLQLGHGERDDGLVDEHHRDREDHRREDERLARLRHGRFL